MMKEIVEGYRHKLKGQFFGALNEREKNGQWEKYLETILLDLMGRAEVSQSIDMYILIGKVATLRFLNYKYFRKGIFECINLVDTYVPFDKAPDIEE